MSEVQILPPLLQNPLSESLSVLRRKGSDRSWQQFGSTRIAPGPRPDPGSSAGLKSVAFRWRHRVQTQELKAYRNFESSSTRTACCCRASVGVRIFAFGSYRGSFRGELKSFVR